MAYPQELALAQLALASNYRTTFIPSEIAEITASALALVGDPPKPRGIVEPLIVRPPKKLNGPYEIVCGGKRFRAAGDAQLPAVPVRVIEIADEEVIEFQLIENLIRSNPHPMQEAEGFQALLAMHKDWTADTLATRIGRDRSYVYKRLQFMQLIKPAQVAFREDRIHIGHALEICRLPAKKQPEAFECCFPSHWNGRKHVHDTKGKATESVGELRRWIRENLLCDLATAPWPKDDAELVPKAGACTTCPKHTGANTALFDDMAKKGDQCLDADCFAQKRAAFVLVQIDQNPGMPRITLDYSAPPKGVLARDGNGYRLVRPGQKCKSAEPAIVAAGDQQVGQKVLICLDRECKTHYVGHYAGGSGANRTPAQVAADRRKRLELKIKEATQRAVLQKIADPQEFDVDDGLLFIGARMIERVGHDNRRELCAALGLEGIKRSQYHGKDFEKPLVDKLKEIRPAARAAFIVAIAACNAFYARGYSSEPARLKEAAAIAGVDVGLVGRVAAKPLKLKYEQAQKRAKAKKKTAPAAKAKAAAK